MYVLYADGEILKVRFASQFEVAANPVIISVFLWTSCWSHPQTHPHLRGTEITSKALLTLASLPETLQYALIMTSRVIQPFPEILPSV